MDPDVVAVVLFTEWETL